KHCRIGIEALAGVGNRVTAADDSLSAFAGQSFKDPRFELRRVCEAERRCEVFVSHRVTFFVFTKQTECCRLALEGARGKQISDSGNTIDSVETSSGVDQIIVHGRRFELPPQAKVQSQVRPDFPRVLSVKRPLVLMVVFSETIKDILLRITIKRGRSIDRAHTSCQDRIKRLSVCQLCGVRSREIGIRSRVSEHVDIHRIVGRDSEYHLWDHLCTRGLGELVNAQERSTKIQSVSAFEEGYVIGDTLRRCITARRGPAIIKRTGAKALCAEKRSCGEGVAAPEIE